MRNISEAALLVQVKVSQWGASKTDSERSADVVSDAGGEAGAYVVIKRVIPKRFLEPIDKSARRLRQVFHKYTMPWLHDGTGILPITLHEKFMNEHLSESNKFEAAVEDLIRNMPSIRHAAQTHLGSGYNDRDIPSDEQLRCMFNIRCRFMPIPEAGDFRVSMNEDVVNAIKQDYESDMMEQVHDSLGRVYARVIKVLDDLVSGLERHGKAIPGAKRAGSFREGLFNNLWELSDILDDLNITNDEYLRDLSSEIRTKLVPFRPDQLREDDDLRAEVIEDAKALTEKAKDRVSNFFGV